MAYPGQLFSGINIDTIPLVEKYEILKNISMDNLKPPLIVPGVLNLKPINN